MKTRNNITPETAATEATLANASMGAIQVVAAIGTGNLGFVGESLHNIGDSASFWAKRSAMDAPPEIALRRRRLAASLFALGGASGIAAASYEFASRYQETTSTLAISIATACAGLNTYIARRTHSAVKNDQTGETVPLCGHSHDDGAQSEQKQAAMLDTKLHALNDAGTGWLYVAGLGLQRYGVHDAATYAVAVNGVIATAGATFTLNRVRRDD